MSIEDLDGTLPPICPGEILLEEFLMPLNISIAQFASDADLTYGQAEEYIKGKVTTTPEMAEKLAEFTGTSVEFWLNLQEQFDDE